MKAVFWILAASALASAALAASVGQAEDSSVANEKGKAGAKSPVSLTKTEKAAR